MQDGHWFKDTLRKKPFRFLQAIILLLLLLPALYGSNAVAETKSPDPLRWDKEINRFSWQDAKNSYPEQAILFVGSSSIYGWKTAQAFPRLPIINRGLRGAHISDIDYYFEILLKQYHPAKIIYYCGENDLADEKPPAQVSVAFEAFSVRIKKELPKTILLFLAIKPNPLRWKLWNRMAETNRAIKNYCQSSGLCLFLDTASPLLNAQGVPDKNLFAGDGLHLNPAGYAVWNHILAPYLTIDSKQ